jgi:membrane protein YqaA with SNARE-associated domain
MFLLCSLRFAEPARREKADVSFWRVLRRVFMEDVGIIAVLLLTLTTLGELRPWTSVAGWLGAGVAGFGYGDRLR